MSIKRPPHDVCHSTGTRSALTLVELMLSLVLMTLIASAISGMLFAMVRGTSEQNDLREMVGRQKAIESRLTAALRGSRMVLASGTDYVVLWMHDNHVNTSPDFSEIRLIERDPTTQKLTSYVASFPAGYTQAQIDAADIQYQFNSDFRTITTNLIKQANFPGTLWGTNITSMQFTYEVANVQQADLVMYRIGISESSAGKSNLILGGTALRNH